MMNRLCLPLLLIFTAYGLNAQISPNFTWSKTHSDTCAPASGEAHILLANTSTGSYDQVTWEITNLVEAASISGLDLSTAQISFDPLLGEMLPPSLMVRLTVFSASDTAYLDQAIPISIAFQPIADFTPHFLDSLALGAPTTFTSEPLLTSGTMVSSYLWDFGDGITSSLANPTHAYAATGTYFVTLRVTDNNGCTSAAKGEGAILGIIQVK